MRARRGSRRPSGAATISPQLTERAPAGIDRALAGEHQHPQHLASSVGARVGRMAARQRGPGRPHGIEGVRLAAAARAATPGPVDLHHLLAGAQQVAAQPGAVGATSLERPGARTHAQGRDAGQRPPVAGRPGIDHKLVQDLTGAGAHHRQGVGVAVGVDTDDDVHLVCQHPLHLHARLGEGAGLGHGNRVAEL